MRKKKKLLCKTIGYAKTKKTLIKATDRGLVDSTESTLSRAVEKADLVILATPLSTFKPLIQEMAPFLKRGCIITDTGSAKYLVIEELKDLIPSGVEFIPGHPIAGTEESGPDSGFPELFDNRWCILTPTKNNSKDSYNYLFNIGGDLFINHPKNKSSRRDLPKFPSFISKKSTKVYFDLPEEYGEEYDSSFYFSIDQFQIDSLDKSSLPKFEFPGTFFSNKIFDHNDYIDCIDEMLLESVRCQSIVTT